MGKIQLTKIFIRFLKEQNCYNKYQKNMANCVFEPKFYRLSVKNIFLYSDNPIEDYFQWSSTKEGYDYWKNISLLWVNLYYKIIL